MTAPASAPVGFSRAEAFNDLIDKRAERPIETGLVPAQNQLTVAKRGVGVHGELVADIVGRASAIGAGAPACIERADERVERCYHRALALTDAGGASSEMRRAAAVEFLGNAMTTLALDGALQPGEGRAAVLASAQAIGLAPGAALLAVYLRALSSGEAAQVTPQVAMDLFVWLLVELGPARAVSFWVRSSNPRLASLASAGATPKSRRMREAAAAVLNDDACDSPHLCAVVVQRWDRPHAALVARTCSADCVRMSIWLREAAAVLSPVLEREALYDRSAERERELVSAAERRLLRIGYDLHDGPLQELAALAQDLRMARDQISPVVAPEYRDRIAGRFADLEARLGALDGGLRDLAHSVRPSTVVERPFEQALMNELESFSRVTDIDTKYEIDGDLGNLTDSQKIALYRLVQESLANVRKHSAASHAHVGVRSRANYVEVTIRDDGCGFDLKSALLRAVRAKRLGLAGVNERIRLLGGVVEIQARVGEGVTVRATLPRWRPTAAPTSVPTYATTG
jgi:signal transduction histidine kinase